MARLEARAEMASEVVAEGLRARLSYLEAAGWLRCAHVWIHPRDLALRDNAVTGSYAAAMAADRLSEVLPATMAQESELEAAPSDILVNNALRLARLWRRIAELRSWRPLANADTLRETLRSLGCGTLDKPEMADWLGSIRALDRGPVLIRAGRAARDWLDRAGVEPYNPAGYFAAACLWREETAQRPIPLPFWSAPELYHHRLGLRIGLDWMAQFLECVTAAALTGLRELARLLEAEKKRADIRCNRAFPAAGCARCCAARAGRHRGLSGENPSRDAACGARLAAAADGGRIGAGSDRAGVVAGLCVGLINCRLANVHLCTMARLQLCTTFPSASPPLSR